MNTLFRIAGIAILLVFVLVFGFWLSRSGKPYPAAPFTLHKLAALAALILLGSTLYKLHQAAALNPLQIMAVIVTLLFFLATIITGGLVSVDKVFPPFVARLHQWTPYLTLLSTAVTMYLILGVQKVFATG